MSNEIKLDEPLSPAVIESARSLYAPPGGESYWHGLEARVLGRVAESAASAAAGWWMVVGSWASAGLATAAAALIAAAVGLLLLQAHRQEVRLAYESAIQMSAADSLSVPTGALSERDGPDTRSATFRDVISQ